MSSFFSLMATNTVGCSYVTRTRPASRSSISPRLTWRSLASSASPVRMRASWASRAATIASCSSMLGSRILSVRRFFNEGTTSPLGSPPVVSEVEPSAKSPALAVVARRPSLAEVELVDPAAYRQGALF